MEIRRMNGKVEDITDKEIIELLKNGVKFYLVFDGGEAMVSADIWSDKDEKRLKEAEQALKEMRESQDDVRKAFDI